LLEICGGFLLFGDKLMERQTAGFENLYFCKQFGHIRYSKLNQKNVFTFRLTSLPTIQDYAEMKEFAYISPQLRFD